MRSTMLKVLQVAFAVILPVSAQQPAPDLILFNGKVFTSNASRPYVDAIAIRGERILAVGISKEIISLAGKETKRIDLAGRTVIPGINDAHFHFFAEPDAYDLPIESKDPSWQQIKDAVSTAVAKVPKGGWIEGVFGSSVFYDPQATRAALDEIAPDDPVILHGFVSPAKLLNSAAFRKLGIREDEPNPVGGEFVRNPTNGKLIGMVTGFAAYHIGDRFEQLATDQQVAREFQDYFEEARRLGITTVQVMAYSVPAKRCLDILSKAPPPMRVRVIWFGLTDERGRVRREVHKLAQQPPSLVTVSGTKWILDGTPPLHSGAMREPYSDRPSTSGDLYFSQKEMEDMLRESLRDNDQLMVHVAGDRTAETFLNAMDATGGEEVWAQRRVRFEHGDGLLPDLIPRAKRLGIVVVQNPSHFTLPDLFVKRFGEKRANQLQPLRSLLDARIPVAIGSDGPDNPYLNIMFASTFSRHPAEAITREQAVSAYTLSSAYAEFTEQDKGTLEPGKLADIVVLSQDIFSVPASDLPKTESVLTMVGGKIVYDRKTLATH